MRPISHPVFFCFTQRGNCCTCFSTFPRRPQVSSPKAAVDAAPPAPSTKGEQPHQLVGVSWSGVRAVPRVGGGNHKIVSKRHTNSLSQGGCRAAPLRPRCDGDPCPPGRGGSACRRRQAEKKAPVSRRDAPTRQRPMGGCSRRCRVLRCEEITFCCQGRCNARFRRQRRRRCRVGDRVP